MNVDELAKAVVAAVRRFVSKSVQVIADRLTALENQVATIKALPVPKDGKDGIDGKDGLNGKDGADGKNGLGGRDAYEIAKEFGFAGTKAQWVESLKGKDGDPGRDGRDGKEGPAGRDGLRIEPLPDLDPKERYARGTYACYRGGLIRAQRATDPIEDGDLADAGWIVVMDGVAEESEQDIDSGRQVERTTTYTSGRKFVRTRQTSSVIYRGIWQAKEYAKGDTVTRDGSLWICDEPTMTAPGLGTPEWKLVAKRGRDGKDAGYK